jgi:threonine/homoserine/homoserine lactone efflux protein
VRRSGSHMLGIQAGMVLLIVMSHLGVGALLLALPAAMTLLRWACFAYLLWLALAILRDARREAKIAEPQVAGTARPMNLLQALSFQLINPKAWMMAVTTVSAFYGGAPPTWLDLAAATLVCTVIGSNSMLVWTVWGAAIDRLLTQSRARQLFAYCMAALVVATAIWMLY